MYHLHIEKIAYLHLSSGEENIFYTSLHSDKMWIILLTGSWFLKRAGAFDLKKKNGEAQKTCLNDFFFCAPEARFLFHCILNSGGMLILTWYIHSYWNLVLVWSLPWLQITENAFFFLITDKKTDKINCTFHSFTLKQIPSVLKSANIILCLICDHY